jgi:glyoxylase-like metal-dependent hydrolase (beta-lactamase superfamily II)
LNVRVRRKRARSGRLALVTGVNVEIPRRSATTAIIVHGGDLMMWDSGYSDTLINSPDGVVGPRSTAFVKKTLASQLAELGIKPTQITRVAFSHTHGDHVGNANMFTGAILYIQQPEFDAAFRGTDPGQNSSPLRMSNAHKFTVSSTATTAFR